MPLNDERGVGEMESVSDLSTTRFCPTPLKVSRKPSFPNHELSHHAGVLMFKDVAVVHVRPVGVRVIGELK